MPDNRQGLHRKDRILLGLALLGMAGALFGQDLEPRAYSAAPIGTHFLILVPTYTSGDVLLDPSLPVRGVTAKLGMAAAGYATTFKLAGRTATAAVTLPYVLAKVSGMVGEDLETVTLSGFGDIRVRAAVNLLGSRALRPQEFARRKPAPALGASLVVVAPSGRYDPDKLINIGTHRWTFKPELGLSLPSGKWVLDLAGGVWLYTDNADFFGGQRRSQAALWTTQAHVSYTFRPGLWLAADATFYAGGRTRVDGVIMDDRQENSRGGLTLSVPFAKAYALKFSWATGVSTRIGGHFTIFAAAFQYRWFGR